MSTIRRFRAPGRVNLIGDHTDYNDGFVLPLAIDRECVVSSRRRDDGRVRVRSVDLVGNVDVAADGRDEAGRVDPFWGRYVAGVVRVLAERGRAPVGIDAHVSSTVPVGSGLSSSAALEVAVALALADVAGFELDPLELALACQRAELLATGVPCGVMDQLTAVRGEPGHALLIDCRDLTIEPIRLPSNCAVLVFHSGIARTLEGSEYAQRRRECEAEAHRLRIRALRDASFEDVAHNLRARHVVRENARVLEFAGALATCDRGRLGALMLESHASLRDDFEVSTAELDLLVELLVEHGADGARLTGAGFGGCVVALADPGVVAEVSDKTIERYRTATGLDATAFRVHAAAGAGPLPDRER